MQLQQGDVLLKSIDQIPRGTTCVERRERGYVVAQGELTGHAHIAEGDISLYERDDIFYLAVGPGGGILVHEEHLPVTLPSHSLWEVDRVREYDHFAEEAWRIKD